METFFSECCVAFSDSGRPHRIRCGLIDFPMDLILVPSEEDKQILTNCRADPTNARAMMQAVFRRRSLLVLGAGFAGGAVKFPERYYTSFVVLILRHNGHYGFRKKRYIEGDATTWEGETDEDPCDFFWDSCLQLIGMGTQPRMSCIGTSAGVDSILSVVATQTDSERQQFNVDYFVAIAGAFHPQLYYQAAHQLWASMTCVIVQHHRRDKLCWWPPVLDVWTHLKEMEGLHVFINELHFSLNPLVGRSFHNVSSYLLTQTVFWDIFMYYNPETFAARCTRAKLGNYHETMEEFREVGHDSVTSRLSHFLMFALCVCKAGEYAARKAWTPTEWIAALAEGARSMKSSFHDEEVRSLIQQLAVHTRVDTTKDILIPYVLAESIMAACNNKQRREKQSGIYKASQLHGSYVCLDTTWCAGPLMLVHLTFPKERNNGSAWADFLYDRRLRLDTQSHEFEDQRNWPLKPSALLHVNAPAGDPSYMEHHRKKTIGRTYQ